MKLSGPVTINHPTLFYRVIVREVNCIHCPNLPKGRVGQNTTNHFFYDESTKKIHAPKMHLRLQSCGRKPLNSVNLLQLTSNVYDVLLCKKTGISYLLVRRMYLPFFAGPAYCLPWRENPISEECPCLFQGTLRIHPSLVDHGFRSDC